MSSANVRAVGVVAALGLFSAALTGASAGQPASANPVGRPDGSRPNILLILSDDQTLADLEVMTKTRRQLAGRGTTFVNAISNTPLCCPARASMLTGQYAHNHGTIGNVGRWGGFRSFVDNEPNTVATWLQDAGYATVFIGKYLNKYGFQDPEHVPPGWTDWMGAPGSRAYNYRRVLLNHDGRLVEHDGYQTEVYAQLASRAITRYAARRKPFFVWASFTAPHGGRPVERDDPMATDDVLLRTPALTKQYRDAFADTPLPRPASYNEADVSDKPAAIQALEPLTGADLRVMTEAHEQRLESLLYLDDAVGKLLGQLRRTGVAHNTLVIFVSDNGYLLGQHRIRNGKNLPYEEALRVPLLLRGPGVPAGVVRRQPVGVIDLAPTMADAAVVEPGLPVDGRSLLPLAADPGLDRRRPMVIEGGSGNAPHLRWKGVRKGRWQYVEYVSGERELYDLRDDPTQLKSRHDEPRHQRTERRLARLTDRLCAADPCSWN